MEIKLIVVGGRTKKTHVTLGVPATIGRSRKADLTVAHPMISRQHCQVFEADGLLRIRDLGSLNGTIVGGKPVAEAPLRPNDEFTVGPITFRVEYDYGGEETAEAPDSVHGGDPYRPPDLDVVESGADEPDLIPIEVQHSPSDLVETPESQDIASVGQAGFHTTTEGAAVPSPEQPPCADLSQPAPGPTVNLTPSDGQLPDFAAWDQRALEIKRR